MEFITQAIAWMRLQENVNLAGWAQAVGATVALALAIGVPAYQRYTQILDMRRQQASLNLALASSVRFLLTDVQMFIDGAIRLSHLPRNIAYNELEVSHLLERIHALENREFSYTRITSLYIARSALVITQRFLRMPDFENKPLSKAQLVEVNKSILRLEERCKSAEFDEATAQADMRNVDLFWPARPIAKAILRCQNFYKHRCRPWLSRLFGTK